MEISSDTLDFGMDGDVAYFSLSNTGKGELNFNISGSEDWITAEPGKGTLSDSSLLIRVSIDRSKIPSPTTIRENLSVTSEDETRELDLFINRLNGRW